VIVETKTVYGKLLMLSYSVKRSSAKSNGWTVQR